jgi:predicted transcriptional regulator of viral defense system
MEERETPEQLIARLAAAHHGVVDRAGLAAAGLTRGEIDGRRARGHLHQVHRGVYAVGHTALSRQGRWAAAVLACGPSAVLSHRSAAVLWGMAERDAILPHVTVRHRRRVEGVLTHRGALSAADTAVRLGIPVTSPSRTLVDEARRLRADAEVERLVREAQFRGCSMPAAYGTR